MTEAEFWAKFEVSADGCWNWTGSTLRSGYGQVKYHGQQLLSHRLAAHFSGILKSIEKQSVGSVGDLICHRCDNRRCGNPKHLYLGSARTNYADARDRGRIRPPSGESHHAAKLSESEVRAIRDSQESDEILSEKFGVTPRTVRKIKARTRWAHLPD